MANRFVAYSSKTLESWPRWKRALTCYVLLVIVSAIDFLTGYELSSSIFYVLPVFIAAWYLGKRQSVLFSFVCALVWTAVDILSNHVYTSSYVVAWNGAVRFGLFYIIAVLAASFREQLNSEAKAAKIDPLTGVENRRGFDINGTKALEMCRRIGRPVTLAYFDLDNLKTANDNLGHKVGDDILTTFARTVNKTIRKTDEFARLGGDEFALLLIECDHHAATEVLTNIKARLDVVAAKKKWPITISIGAITWQHVNVDLDTMIHATDELMYTVKRSGKNSISFRIAETNEPGSGKSQENAMETV